MGVEEELNVLQAGSGPLGKRVAGSDGSTADALPSNQEPPPGREKPPELNRTGAVMFEFADAMVKFLCLLAADPEIGGGTVEEVLLKIEKMAGKDSILDALYCNRCKGTLELVWFRADDVRISYAIFLMKNKFQ
jgi:hypothetical protein